MQILDVENPPREECGHPRVELEPPRELVEPRSEKRLVSPLREAARTRDAMEILARAALWGASSADPHARRVARALADLAATGSYAAATLAKRPSVRDVAALATIRAAAPPPAGAPSESLVASRSSLRDDADALQRAAAEVVARAELVARYLERGASGRAALAADTPSLSEWLGVSGEDDPPHRPVNIPFASSVERSISVDVRGHALRVRYAAAGAIEGGAPIVLLLHGHCSRLEEVERVAEHLGALRDARGRPRYCVLMPDLPSAGYSSRIDHEAIAPLDARGAPLLAFHEEFVEAFVEAVTREMGVPKRVACVGGGSMGGNLVLRLAESQPPWIERYAAWSPASVWSALTGDLIKGLGLRRTRINMCAEESEASRRKYFEEVFATTICLTGRTQPEMWYRDGLACRPRHINRALWDRRELYGPELRRWHWRLAHEQLLFSHITPYAGVAPWERIRGPVLLIAGERDNFKWTHIYERTRDLARRLATKGVRGACLLLKNTGHSIHDERPRLLAGAIDRFVERYA